MTVVSFFFCLGFLSHILIIRTKIGEVRGPSLFFVTVFILSRTFRGLFAVLHLRWLPFCFQF